MKKLEGGLTVIESFADMKVLYLNGELAYDKPIVLYDMAGRQLKYCVSDAFWRKLKNRIDFFSDDRSLLCRFDDELVKISYSNPRYTILIITVEKAKVYDVGDLE